MENENTSTEAIEMAAPTKPNGRERRRLKKEAAAKRAAAIESDPNRATKKMRKRAAKVKSKGKRKLEAGKTRLHPDLARYVVSHDVRTGSGRAAIDSNDAVAQKLRGWSLDETFAFAAKTLEVPEMELRERYSHLNLGMQRMNLGNKIRARLA